MTAPFYDGPEPVTWRDVAVGLSVGVAVFVVGFGIAEAFRWWIERH